MTTADLDLEAQMAQALQTFTVEAQDLMVTIESCLLDLESGRDTDEAVAAVFRAVHTIKGSSGLFGLDHVVRFAHVVESVLDRVRCGEIPPSQDLVSVLLPCGDHLRDLIDAVVSTGTEPPAGSEEKGQRLLAALQPYLAAPAGQGQVPEQRSPVAGERTGQAPAAGSPDGSASGRTVHVSARFAADSLRNGMDPLPFLRYLGTLGEPVSTATVTELLPAPEEMDPETCYLAFEVTLRTETSVEDLENVFDFVAEDGDIRVLEHGGPRAAFDDLIESYGPLGPGLRELLEETGALDEAPEQPAAPVPAPEPVAPAEPGDPQVAAQPAVPVATRPAGPVAAEPAGPVARPKPSGGESGSIRVDAGRLDRLIDSVGELVIAGAGAGLQVSAIGDEQLELAIGEVMRLVEEVRDSALQLRMLPIGSTFGRFQRVVRDVSSALGKDVALVVTGGDTEVDKALAEQITDPLTHLVRNSLDHGLESPDEREAAGKPRRGTLQLNAFHDSGSIVIEVTDDGGGINTDAVLRKAVERGLVEPGVTPSDQAIHEMIFEPGFSTAAQVSDISGRGVGMDVVKRNITALRGSIEIDSVRGRGTTMRLRLPLTLAIIDGFLVGVGSATFVIPLDRVVECVALPEDRHSFDCMDLRGSVLPYVRLRDVFAVAGEPPRRENVVVVEHAGKRTGFVVDVLKGEFQTVIKPLGGLFEGVAGVGGSTILGNGDVALIIDVAMLVKHVEERDGARHGPRALAAAVG